MRRNKTWGRREFLKAAGLGTGAMLAPYIPILEQEAQAQGGFPKRLVLITTPCGSVMNKWRPTGTETNFNPSYILQPFVSDAQRSGKPSHKDKLLIVDGIDSQPMDGGGHDHRAVIFSGEHLTNVGESLSYHTGESIDQTVARRINQNTAFPEGVHLGVSAWEKGNDGKSPRGFAFAKKNPAGGLSIPFSPMIDPRVAYDTIFRGTGGGGDSKDSLRRGLVFGHIKHNIGSLSGKLSKADQARLDQHLDSVNQLEQRLLDSGSCTAPARPPQYTNGEVNARGEGSGYKTEEITEHQLSIAAAALACGLTQVIGFQWGTDGSTGEAPYVPSFPGSDIHAVSHDGDATAQNAMADLNRWYALRFARFLDKLAAYPEGNGTLLDNTLVVWVKAMSSGNSHSNRNNPVVLMQGANSYFPMGRYVTYGSFADMAPRNGQTRKDYGGQPINRLLVSICHAMGLEDITKVGSGDTGSGPLADLR